MKTKNAMNTAAQVDSVDFANRFSLEDWSWLCGFADFSSAIEEGELGQAEVIAHRKFTERADIERGAMIMTHQGEEHDAVAEFVAVWALRCGRQGRKWKQARQNHIRRLMVHGLDGNYAAAMLK